MAKVFVIGSTNTDMLIKTDNIPVAGITVEGNNFMINSGGKGANQAVAGARLDGIVSLLTRVGKDDFGSRARERFAEERIQLRNVIIDPNHRTGVSLIMVGPDGQSAAVVDVGANANLSVADVEDHKMEIEICDVLLLQLQIPIASAEHAIEIGAELGKTIILNANPAKPLKPELLKKVSVFSITHREAEYYSGVPVKNPDDALKAADALHKQGIKTVIITLGKIGVFYSKVHGENETINKFFKAHSVDTIDSTSATDVFNGALAVFISEGHSLEQAVMYANAASAISTTKMGAQRSAPSRQELNEFLSNM